VACSEASLPKSLRQFWEAQRIIIMDAIRCLLLEASPYVASPTAKISTVTINSLAPVMQKLRLNASSFADCAQYDR